LHQSGGMPPECSPILELLDVKPIGSDRYRAISRPNERLSRLYGGQVVAQALRAATMSTDPRYLPQSLHSYFVRMGDQCTPIDLDVERTRDGRSFATRRVVARQSQEVVLVLEASFHVDEPGASYQRPRADDVPEPDDDSFPWLPTLAGYHGEMFEMRSFAPEPPDQNGVYLSGRRFWIRSRDAITSDPAVHAAVLAYVSDLGATRAAHVPINVPFGTGMHTSLDHSIWFHRPAHVDDWLLFDFRPIANARGRGLVRASVHARHGDHIATVAQEVLIRPDR
jgi:acyl-CoA thioesterase-2